MAESISLRSPELLHIRPGTYGADQLWYSSAWQQRAGCGPTVASHLLWYLSRTRPGCGALCPHDGAHRAGFLRLMEDVWQSVTPGVQGVNTTAIFTRGVERYGADRGVPLRCRVLNVPPLPPARPTPERLEGFLSGALADDLPVAFLNLSNGSLRCLESWHWVTLVALGPGLASTMYDQGERKAPDLDLWLRSTTLGGGFVAVEPANQLEGSPYEAI